MDEYIINTTRFLRRNPTPAEDKFWQIVRNRNIDGFKFYLEDDSWILFRPSGTEPLVRIYMEAHSKARLDVLADEATKIFLGEKTAATT